MTTALLYLFTSTRRACSPEREADQGKASGFTLVELLVAMCVSLLLLGGVVSLFGSLGESVNNSKSNSEMLQTMRHTARQLQSDLGNVSLVPDPAQTMSNPQGFFEYVEGPLNDTRDDLAAAAAEPELPPAEFVDNQDAGYTEDTAPDVTKNIGLGSAGGSQNNAAYNNNTRRAYSKYLHGYGQWQKTGLESGTYRVSITWPTGWTSAWTSKHESNIPVTITAGDNTESVTVDQTQEPNDLDEDGTGWKHLGEIDVTDGEILVQIGPCGQGYAGGKFVFADAIRIECLELTGGEDGVKTLPLAGDCDDVLHFTTKKDDGAYEVVWFLTPMTGTPKNSDGTANSETRYRLHRYARPVEPNADDDTTEDLSFGADGTPNALEDLALRKNRFAHFQGETEQFTAIPQSDYETMLTQETYNPDNSVKKSAGQRIRETTILENVLSFDVRAYDPEARLYPSSVLSGDAYTKSQEPDAVTPTAQTLALGPNDPGYVAASTGTPIGKGTFVDLNAAYADPASPLQPDAALNATYDSWSGDYLKAGDVGFDNWNASTGAQTPDGIVDTAEDLREPPPYDAPLRAVQVEIRMQEPESGKVRSVKVRKFLGKR